MRISDWSSDVCSSDLGPGAAQDQHARADGGKREQGAHRDHVAKKTDREQASHGCRDGTDDYGADIRSTVLGVDLAEQARHQAVFGHRVEDARSEEHTSELQSLMRISYAVFCLKKKINHKSIVTTRMHHLY